MNGSNEDVKTSTYIDRINSFLMRFEFVLVYGFLMQIVFIFAYGILWIMNLFRKPIKA
jgi:hypothetical protein